MLKNSKTVNVTGAQVNRTGETHKMRSESSREGRSLRTCSIVGTSAFIPKQWENSRSSEQLYHYRFFVCNVYTNCLCYDSPCCNMIKVFLAGETCGDTLLIEMCFLKLL